MNRTSLAAAFTTIVACSSAPGSAPAIDASHDATSADVAVVDAGVDASSPDAWTELDADIAPDAWAVDAASACVLAPQAGCTGAQACRITSSGAACEDVGANPGEYSACTMVSDCAAGMQCLGADPTVFTCRRFCALGDTSTCGSGRVCRAVPTLYLVDGSSVSLPSGTGVCGSP